MDLCEMCPSDDFDLCFSIGFLDHIPEEYLPTLFTGMERCERGLHGIDCSGPNFDRTRCTIKPIEWWRERLPKGHEVFHQQELESGELPPDYIRGDGKVKLNIGSFTTMFHHGWENIDVHNLVDFANQNKYKYRMLDVRQGLPHGTGTVDMIFACHMLEHLDYAEGLRFLRDCRRVIKGNGAMRIIVPDAKLLNEYYSCDEQVDFDHQVYRNRLDNFNELNDGCANSITKAGKLWALLHEGHHSCYDAEMLCSLLRDAGFEPLPTEFRLPGLRNHDVANPNQVQMVNESLDMLPDISLFVDAVPN